MPGREDGDVSEVYAQIEKDLIEAIVDLPIQQAQVGRVTKGAAQGLLGKVYLYNEKFEPRNMVAIVLVFPLFDCTRISRVSKCSNQTKIL